MSESLAQGQERVGWNVLDSVLVSAIESA